MATIYYRPGRLALWALLWLAIGSWNLWDSDGDGTMLSTVVGSILLCLGAFAAWSAFDTRPAIVADGAGMTVRTLFARRTMRWSDVLLITIEQRRMQSGAMLPLGKRRFLSIMLPPQGLDRVRDDLLALRAAAGQEQHAMEVRGVGRTDFDADAAIARYLETKRSAAVAADPPAPNEATPQPTYQPPPRPTFGRRVA
jgi:hypothetical protein